MPHERLCTENKLRNADLGKFGFVRNAVFSFLFYLSSYHRPNEPVLFPVLEEVRDVQCFVTAGLKRPLAYRFPSGSIEHLEIVLSRTPNFVRILFPELIEVNLIDRSQSIRQCSIEFGHRT